MFGLVLRLIAIGLLLLVAVIAAVEFSSLNWPHTSGTVLAGNWEANRGAGSSGNGEYLVIYSYNVNGREYQSRRISWATESPVVKLNGGKEERQPHETDEVTVYYASWWPSLSVLIPGGSPTIWIWGVVAALVGVILWIVARFSLHPMF